MALLVHAMILTVTSVGGVIAAIRLGVGLDTGGDAVDEDGRWGRERPGAGTRSPPRLSGIGARGPQEAEGAPWSGGSPNTGSEMPAGSAGGTASYGSNSSGDPSRPVTRRNSSV